MTHSTHRRAWTATLGHLSWALLLALSLSNTANALDVPETEFTPESYALIDGNGVDVSERALNIGHSITIGDPANGGLSYSVSYSSAGTWKFYHSRLAYVRHDVFQDLETGLQSEA